MAQRPVTPRKGLPAFFVVRCHEERKPPRFGGDRCDGFVARFPYPVRFVRIVEHSDSAHSGHYVAACKSCGRLYEMRAD